MNDESAILELKFEGNGIKPSKVKASEVAELIKSFETSILSIVKENHEELKEDFVLLSFEEIKDESLGIKFMGHLAKQYVLPAYIALTSAVNDNTFNNIPNKSIETLKEIIKFSKKYKCEGAFLYNGKRIATFNSETQIEYNQNSIVRGETVIYGEVLKAGGVKPRAQLKIDDNYTLSFEVSKRVAKKLASNLYAVVGLSGNATWDKKTYKVLDFKANDVIEIRGQDEDLDDTFNKLGKLLGKHINDKGDYSQYIN